MGQNRRYPTLTRGYAVQLLDAAGSTVGWGVPQFDLDRAAAEARYRAMTPEARAVGHVVVLRDGAMVLARSDRQ